jgi:hypothetical protein
MGVQVPPRAFPETPVVRAFPAPSPLPLNSAEGGIVPAIVSKVCPRQTHSNSLQPR